jgi:glycosyltransferase involved in cell wall biosynthesis
LMSVSPEPPGRVLLVGPLPPPVHGMAVVTREILGALRGDRKIEVGLADTSPGTLLRGPRYHLSKLRRVVRAVGMIGRAGRKPAGALYMPVDAGWGMAYSIVLAGLGRARGLRVFLHHHSTAYTRRRTFRAVALAAVSGPHSTHIIVCPAVARRFAELYGERRRCRTLSNAFLVPPREPSPHRRMGPITMGHFGNLSVEKGLDSALHTIREAGRRGIDARLVLAGAAAPGRATRMLETASRELGDRLVVRGDVGSVGKDRFFREIDLFLFPSRLAEIQGIVNLEAMSYGVVPIAFGHGCIPSDFADHGGIVVGAGDRFSDAVLARLEEWSRDPEALVRARRRARERFAGLRSRAAAELEELMNDLLDRNGPRDADPLAPG